jgi:CBS domain-containing protein
MNEKESIEHALVLLKSTKSGSVIVCSDDGMIVGIFTERDFILKVADTFEEKKNQSISNFMTNNPIVETSECTIAHALTLMSEGGFRNLPIIDSNNKPIGVLAIKDVTDYIVKKFIDKLLNFEINV